MILTDGHANTEHICTVCQASFTRKTHLTRHLRSHLNQRAYNCTLCGKSTFTRSDLLTRHMKRCSQNPGGIPPSRKKACQACIQRKVKCNLETPCAKCAARGDECVYVNRCISQAVAEDVPPSGAADITMDQSSSTPDMVHANEAAVVARVEPEGSHLDQRLDPFMDGLMNPPQANSILQYPIGESSLSKLAEPVFSTLSSEPLYLSSKPTFPSPSESVHIDTTFLNDFFNQQNNANCLSSPSPFEYIQSPCSVPRPLGFAAGPLTESDQDVPCMDRYLALYFTAHCRQYPLIHQTLKQSLTPPVLGRAMRAGGALYVTGDDAEGKAADQFILESLQSSLRQQIFRAFIETPPNDIDAQAALILAMETVQNLGIFHRFPEERSVSAAFHGMTITMVRRCAIPAFLDTWEMSADIAQNASDAWKSWARFESMKRILSLAWLQDSLMPTFFNLPPSLSETELPVRLPCDVELWEAPTAQKWAELLNRFSPRPDNLSAHLRGELLHSALAGILNPFSVTIPAPLNRFASFMTLHALLRHIYLAKINDTEQRIFIQHGLNQWYMSWLSGASAGPGSSQPFASGSPCSDRPNFTAAVLPIYWMALLWLGQVDPFVPVSSVGQVRFKTVKRWLKNFWSVLRDVGEVSVGVGLVELPETGSAYIEEMSEIEGPTNQADDAGLLGWVPVW